MKPHLVDLVPGAFNRGRRLFAIATLSAACAASLSPFAYADGGRAAMAVGRSGPPPGHLAATQCATAFDQQCDGADDRARVDPWRGRAHPARQHLRHHAGHHRQGLRRATPASRLGAVGENRPVTFGGAVSTVIPPGGSVTSDPVQLRVFARQDIAVSLYVPGADVQPSRHGSAVVTSYLTPNGGGDVAAEEAATAYTETTTSMLWLKSVDVLSRESPGAIVAFGDSITDGTCTTLDAHDRWEDWLSVRLDLASDDRRTALAQVARTRCRRPAVVNEGIGGNTVTRAACNRRPTAPRARATRSRRVLAHQREEGDPVHGHQRRSARGVRRAGDRGPGGHHPAGQGARHEDLRRHDHPAPQRAPIGNEQRLEHGKTAIRNEVNQWIRTQAPFDGVLDFDKVVRDPDNHDLIYPPFNCGDGIHPSPPGTTRWARTSTWTCSNQGGDTDIAGSHDGSRIGCHQHAPLFLRAYRLPGFQAVLPPNWDDSSAGHVSRLECNGL